MSWIDHASAQPTAEVAAKLGLEVRRHASSSSVACPACGADRRHTKSRDRRGAVGMPHNKPGIWKCFQCDQGGDAVDFVSHHLGGARFRDLPPERKDEVKAFFGFEADTRPLPPMPRRAPQRLPEGWENAETNYPAKSEVERLWEACRAVCDDDGVLAYLDHRDIRPSAALDLHDCARALPPGVAVPPWATFRGEPWTRSGHRLIVPLYDWQGELRSVVARSVERAPEVKSVGAMGHGRRGLVMAGRFGRQMLVSGAIAYWHRMERFRLTIHEGEIDMLRAVAAGADAEVYEDFQPACWRAALGIFSGSFTRDVASRVPAKTIVVLATDDDEQGDKYAQEIRERIGERCDYERVRVADDNKAGAA